nr:RNA-directed DNA polymerase, eukaryota [Tanacetum cinerariifolium]
FRVDQSITLSHLFYADDVVFIGLPSFDDLVTKSWNSFVLDDSNDVQTAFPPNRQILDGPFIINEILARCKLKRQQAMIFKVNFAKAYDSIRWDFLDDVLISFGFGSKWRSWIRGSLYSGKASILVNGSPTLEFHFHRGLKQRDPLAPFLFLFIMESLRLLFSRAVKARIFTSFRVDHSITLSHLFYADNAVFIGVGIPDNCVTDAAKSIGCSIIKAPFKYLGDNMSSIKAWDEAISKMKKRLSRWKLNTLSVGGHLTLLKSVLGSTPTYNMSIFKVLKYVLNLMESLRRNFLMAFKMVIERLLGSNGLRCLLLRNMEGWEFQVFMLSIGLFFSSGYGATFLMIILYGLGLYLLFMA